MVFLTENGPKCLLLMLIDWRAAEDALNSYVKLTLTAGALATF